MATTKTRTLTTRVKVETSAAFSAMAFIRGTSVSALMVEALEEYAVKAAAPLSIDEGIAKLNNEIAKANAEHQRKLEVLEHLRTSPYFGGTGTD